MSKLRLDVQLEMRMEKAKLSEEKKHMELQSPLNASAREHNIDWLIRAHEQLRLRNKYARESRQRFRVIRALI
jgi:hypothetical protein